MSEELVILHCAPTLAGLKTGNLFNCPYTSAKEIKEQVRRLNKIFVPKGLRAVPLRFTEKKVLIYLYRPDRLRKDLDHKTARKILAENGYPCSNPSRCIAKLAHRLRTEKEFPHEIGFFLGYPPEDVEGFIEQGSDKCKCAGCWKVYGDEEKAKRTFARYKKCTDVYHAQWCGGRPMERLAVAAC